ncbi:MAG: transposase [Acidobacteriota bacterium]
MKDERIATIVADAITFFDQDRYLLLAWCVMPNHVHAIFRIGQRIDRILFSWKSFTANKANSLLERTGSFWQDDYYDRLIRDSGELSRTVQYVLENPARAELQHWQWVRSYPDRL